MTSALLAPDLKFRGFDNNGNPLVGGLLTTYAAGTNTPLVSYQDTVGTPNTNPVVLNSRGECALYFPPNVAYKVLLTDSLGNTIPGWPVDNIVNSQLITLYGGVDTGSANAYVLNFTANFTSLTDGIVIYWLASNTNSGASTLNVNSLGVISILNQDGSALGAGEIIANTLVGVLYRAGNFYLILSGQTIPKSSQFTMNTTGFTANPGGTAKYTINGNMVSLFIPYLNATSNSVNFTLTGIPAAIQPASATTIWLPIVADNGSAATAVGTFQPAVPGVITLTKTSGAGGGNWTNSGVKGVGQLLGGILQVGNTVVYSVI